MSHQYLLAAGALAALVASPPTFAGGDAARGAVIYERCAGCHSLDRNRTGPKHCGLIGRRAGSLSDFEYSSAMRASGITWTAQTLDRFLAAPIKVVPGTSMGYAGIDDPRERADLIAWLREASQPGQICASTHRPAKTNLNLRTPIARSGD